MRQWVWAPWGPPLAPHGNGVRDGVASFPDTSDPQTLLTGTVHVTPLCVRPASLMWTAGLRLLVVSLLTGAATYRIANR